MGTSVAAAGDLLRRQREARGLGIDDVAAVLRIKPAYLAALEAGRLDLLPGPTYAFGFIRAYADHLGLDSGEVLRRFRQESRVFEKKPDLSLPMPLAARSMPGGGTLLIAMILAICGYGTWYYFSTGDGFHPQRVAEVPDALLQPSPVPQQPQPATMRPTEALASPPRPVPPAEDTPAPTEPVAAGLDAARAPRPAIAAPSSQTAPFASRAAPASPAATAPSETQTAALTPASPSASDNSARGDATARIMIHASADSWVEIRGAGRSVLLARTLKAGESYAVPDQPGLSMRTGNAGGLEILVDGNPAPSIGRTGMVRRNVALDPKALIAGSAVRN